MMEILSPRSEFRYSQSLRGSAAGWPQKSSIPCLCTFHLWCSDKSKKWIPKSLNKRTCSECCSLHNTSYSALTWAQNVRISYGENSIFVCQLYCSIRFWNRELASFRVHPTENFRSNTRLGARPSQDTAF